MLTINIILILKIANSSGFNFIFKQQKFINNCLHFSEVMRQFLWKMLTYSILTKSSAWAIIRKQNKLKLLACQRWKKAAILFSLSWRVSRWACYLRIFPWSFVILRKKFDVRSFFHKATRPCGDTTSGSCLLRSTCENMASVLLGGRKLTDLRVVDLRQELENRGLEKSGVKAVLIERLQKVICRFAPKNDCHVPFSMQIEGRSQSRPAFL